MHLLLKFSNAVDWLNRQIGKYAIWLILASTVISGVNALVRKIFNTSSNAFLEVQWYLFAAAFLLAAGYTLLNNEHVKIDVIYSKFSRTKQIWIDIIGFAFFLTPVCLAVLWYSMPFFLKGYHSGEMSNNAGGLIRWPVAAPPFPLASNPAWLGLQELARLTFAGDRGRRSNLSIDHTGQSPRTLHVTTRLTDHSTGKAPGLCVMFMHDLREMEARLRTEKLAAMGRMSAAVAHEIRNPLAAITQANALLEEDLTDPAHQRLTQMVAQNARRLARITEEVLDIARVRHQIDHVSDHLLCLDESVAALFQDWSQTAHAASFARTFLQAGEAEVAFDPDHLRRVLVNLLDNALRYIGKHPDSLQISTGISTTGQVGLQVWSDGAPLEKTVEQHLFEPFFSSESRSSGLGLYICRELCERHGATISYQRVPRHTERGLVQGNAFVVAFRAQRPVAGVDDALDTPLV